MKKYVILALIGLFPLCAYSEESKNSRFSFGLSQNTAFLDRQTIAYTYNGTSRTYQTEGFSQFGLNLGYMKHLPVDWFPKKLFWEIDLSLGLTKKEKQESGTCNTGGFLTVSCDVEAHQSATTLAFNLIGMSQLSSFEILYGGGIGYYRITQKLVITASGYEDKEVASDGSSKFAPQIKVGINLGKYQIIYSYTTNIGDSTVGSGPYQKIGFSYGKWD